MQSRVTGLVGDRWDFARGVWCVESGHRAIGDSYASRLASIGPGWSQSPNPGDSRLPLSPPRTSFIASGRIQLHLTPSDRGASSPMTGQRGER